MIGDETDTAKAGPAGPNTNGSGGGGGGVGLSTGNDDSRVTWYWGPDGKCTIVASMTRKCVLKQPESYDYKKVSNWEIEDEFDVLYENFGAKNVQHETIVKTPWYTEHVNQWGCFFSPAQAQYIINTFGSVKIKSLKKRLYDVNVKQKTVNGEGAAQTVSYSNDLCGQLKIACDHNAQLPWAGDGLSIRSLGFINHRPVVLQQYRYYVPQEWVDMTTPTQTSQKKWRFKNQYNADEVQYLKIEDLCRVETLRTGDSYEWNQFDFNAEKLTLTGRWQTPPTCSAPSLEPGVDEGLVGEAEGNGPINYYSARTRLQPFRDGIFEVRFKSGVCDQGPYAYSNMPAKLEATWEKDNYRSGASHLFITDYSTGSGVYDTEGFTRINPDENKGIASRGGRADTHPTQDTYGGNVSAETGTSWHPTTVADYKNFTYPCGAIWCKNIEADLRQKINLCGAFEMSNVPWQSFYQVEEQPIETYSPNSANNSFLTQFATFKIQYTLIMEAETWTPAQRNLGYYFTRLDQISNESTRNLIERNGMVKNDGSESFAILEGRKRRRVKY